jgi:tRNA U34 5-carboxymethylaminomethyl modifying enzyme MnmG/GidA
MTAAQALLKPNTRLDDVLQQHPEIEFERGNVPHLDLTSAETTVKYAGYLRQEASRVERSRREERRLIPRAFPFARVPGLSHEVVQRLSQVRPETLGQASRIPGMTPAAVMVLGAYLDRVAAGIEAGAT